MDNQSLVAGEAPSNANTHILSSDTVNSNCYRKLVFTSGTTSKLRSSYLTPDQQYLSAGLSDTLVDPIAERAAAEAAVAAKLKGGDASLGVGDPAAPFVLTVFEDYQCPYCKRLNDWIAALPLELKAKMYVVSKNLPLPRHSWAKAGASLAVCAYRQSPEAFTELREVLFANQETLQQTDILEQVTATLDTASQVDTVALGLCYNSNGNTDNQIERDVQLAATLEVGRTPTAFVNGRRLTRLTTYEDFLAALSATPAGKPDGPKEVHASTNESAKN
jgi:protein-disulfide isomerase